MKDRIELIIKNAKIKKVDFAKRLNVSQAFVSQMCSGAAKPSDRTISDICREFGIREEWLREGTGPMEVPRADADLAYVNELLRSVDNPFLDMIKAVMKVYMELSPEDKKKAMEFAASLSSEIKKESRD